MKRQLYIGSTFVATIVALGVGSTMLKRSAVHAAAVQAPRFEVDPLWPKPLPNHWILGPDHRRFGRRQRSYLDHSSRRVA